MDTKLKSFKYSNILKTLAFLLIAVSITSAIVQLHILALDRFEPESLLTEKYEDSAVFLHNDAYWAMDTVRAAIAGYKVEDLGDQYYYYYVIGDEVYTNLASGDASFFSERNQRTFILENGHWTYGKGDVYPYGESVRDTSAKAYITFTTDYMNKMEKIWSEMRQDAIPVLINLASVIIVTLLLLFYLGVVAGKRYKEDQTLIYGIDRIPSDVFALLYGGLCLLTVGLLSEIYNQNFWGDSGRLALLIMVGVTVFAFLVMSGFVYMSLIRRIKAKVFAKNSIIFIVFNGFFDFFRSIFDGRKFNTNTLTKQLFYRQSMFIILSFTMVLLTFVLLFIPPLFLLPIVLEFLIIFWYVMGNKKTYEDIDKGFNASLEEQMKAERMKIQLVTNVSHDLKTPLTSIISYTELLSKEENLTDTAKEYVGILADKSNRLKNIVADLFDLAKSTSGDIQLDLETIDLKKLIEQTVADMEDDIVKSGLQFKLKLPASQVLIKADGKKMYRVFQNLIDNAIKYALEGTRVFIDIDEIDHQALVSIKNTAGYEMDFTSEEIIQRFSRGDLSRTTEGSGLGLSIAESFTQVCGGQFMIKIDGDLFKVVIRFDTVEV